MQKVRSITLFRRVDLENNLYDFLVIGGGPVGLFAAIELSNSGKSVALLEKKNFPVDKVCGEGIMPLGQLLLKKNGLSFSSSQSKPFVGIDYFEKRELKAHLTFNQLTGIAVRRTELSDKLKEKALSLGVKIIENATYLGHNQNSNNISCHYNCEGETRALKCQKIIAADGIHSSVRKYLGLKSKFLAYERIGFRWHLQMKPLSDTVQVFWSKGTEAYITPVGDNQIEIALLTFKKSHQKINYYELIDNFPHLKKLIKGQIPRGIKGYGPFPLQMKKMISSNVIFIGDAFAFIDGITGDGLSFGFLQGHLLAKLSNDLETFEKEVINYFRTYKLITYSALLMSYSPLLRKIIYSYPLKKILKIVFNYHFTHGLPLIDDDRPIDKAKQLSLT